MRKSLWLAALAAPLLFSACSSSDSDAPASATAGTPSNINDTPQSFLAYIKALIAETEAGRTDDKEPVGLTNVDPKTSEDAEPEPVS